MSSSGEIQSAVVSGGCIYSSSDYGTSKYPNNDYILYYIIIWIAWAEIFSVSGDWTSITMSSSGRFQSTAIYGGFIYSSISYGYGKTYS